MAPVDSFRQAPIQGLGKRDSWSLSATAKWAIFNAGQEAWLEVLDADGKPIVSFSMFRGNPKPKITSNGGHGNYLVFNDGELMNSTSPDWTLTNGPQELQITVAKGVATVRFGGKVTLERPVLAGDWKRPLCLQLRTTQGGDISVTKAVFVEAAGDGRRDDAVAIEEAKVTSPPLEPAVFAEAIRRLGKNPDDPAVRRQLSHFAWADVSGDYTVQAEELRLSTTGGGSVLFIDDAFNVYLRSDAAGGPDYRVVTPLGRTPTGNPIWDWGQQRPGPNTPFNQTRSLGRRPGQHLPDIRLRRRRLQPSLAVARDLCQCHRRRQDRPRWHDALAGRRTGRAGADPSARADALPDQHAGCGAGLHRLCGLHRQPGRILDRRRPLRRGRLRPARRGPHPRAYPGGGMTLWRRTTT